MAVTPPNFSQIPNEILDKMHEMTPAEFKVLMAICRKTFGWHKERDVISLSQLEAMTGLSRTAVLAGITAGIDRGMLERTQAGKQSFSYRLLVASDYQSTQTTSSAKLPEPVASDYQEPVASDYPQKKEINKLNKSGGDARAREEKTQPPRTEETQVLERLFAIFQTPKQPKRYVAAAAVKRGGFTLADVELCEAWLASETYHGKIGKLANILEAGLLPTIQPSTPPPLIVNGIRRGPQQSVAPDYDIHEAKRRGAARKAELLKDLPSWA